MAAARAAGSAGGTRSPETPSATTSGMPPTADATTGLRRAMASRMEMPCASRSEGSTAMSRSAVSAATSSRRPVKMIWSRAGAGSAAACARSASHWDPSPTMASQASGRSGHDIGPGGDQVGMPLLRLQPCDHAHQHRGAGDAALPTKCAARRGKGEARKVHAVGDDGIGRSAAPLARGPWPGSTPTGRSAGPSPASARPAWPRPPRSGRATSAPWP